MPAARTGEEFYYDTRIYEWTEKGYVPNTEWMEEMKQNYYNAEVYPVDKLMALPHEERIPKAEDEMEGS